MNESPAATCMQAFSRPWPGRSRECVPLTDIKNPRLIYFKGLLFLTSGCIAAGLLLFYSPSLKIAALLAISIWCFARFYYFAFYVVQNYVDNNYRFAGLFSFFAYVIRQQFGWKQPSDDDPSA